MCVCVYPRDSLSSQVLPSIDGQMMEFMDKGLTRQFVLARLKVGGVALQVFASPVPDANLSRRRLGPGRERLGSRKHHGAVMVWRGRRGM